MGYLFLSIALFAGTAKGYCGKKMGNLAESFQSAAQLNLIRMVLCIAFGALFLVIMGDWGALSLSPAVLLIGALSGISTSFFVVSWLISVRKSAYMMLDIFLMLGTLVPMTLSYFIFGEGVSRSQVIGFIIIVAAVIIMCSYSSSVKTKLTPAAVLMLVLCGVSNGITDFSQKMFVKTLPNVPLTVFNLYTYIFAAITLLIIYIALSFKSRAELSEKSPSKYIYIVIMALMLFVNSYFKTKAASYLSSALLYPLNQGMALILSTLMATVFFKEKLTLKCIIGIFFAFVGLLFMNVLNF